MALRVDRTIKIWVRLTVVRAITTWVRIAALLRVAPAMKTQARRADKAGTMRVRTMARTVALRTTMALRVDPMTITIIRITDRLPVTADS